MVENRKVIVIYIFFKVLIFTLYESYKVCGSVLPLLLPQETFLCISASNRGYSYTQFWLNINRNVWNHFAGLQFPSTSSVCLYFLLLGAPPLFMDNWGAQIIIHLASSSKNKTKQKNSYYLGFCNAFVYTHAAFWLLVYYSREPDEPIGFWPIPDVPRVFVFLPLLSFLSLTSLCTVLKHIDPCLVCSLGGTHTRCAHFSWVRPHARTGASLFRSFCSQRNMQITAKTFNKNKTCRVKRIHL